jgi:peptide/nickel transport system substrate-binding protein
MTQRAGRSTLELLREEILLGRLDRRGVLKRALALGLSAPVVAGLLAACGDDDDDDAETTAATATTSGGAQPAATTAPAATATTGGTTAPAPTSAGGATTTTGGTEAPAGKPGHGRGMADLVRILYWQAPTILNVHFSQGTKDSAASSLIQEPLIDIDADGNLIPILAAEIPSLENGGLSEDGLSVTYKLKEGVVWSDGEPFTAEDVKFTWEYTTNEAATTTSIAIFQVIESVDVIDETTVRLNFRSPNPGWFSPFATGFGGAIVPKHILQDFTGEAARDAPFNLEPIGTGPYKLQEFRPGDVVVYEINENYREADKPYFIQVELKGGGDATSAARAALESSEVDWAWNLQVEKTVLEPMGEASDVGTLVAYPASTVERILVNQTDPNTEVNGARSEPSTQHPFLQFLEVRQAFALGCDRETIATELYGVAGQATSNLLVSPTVYASPNTTAEFDPEAAAALLEAAGWIGSPRSKDGVEMKVLYQTSINPVRQKTQEIIKQSWEAMGISVELKSIDAAVYFASDAGNPDTASHFYADFEMFTNGNTVPFPIDYMASWVSRDPAVDLAQQSNAWAGTNATRWVNEEFNELYTQARTELDPAKSAELFIQMNDLAVNGVAEIPLVHRASVIAHTNRLQGFTLTPWSTDVRDIADWYFEE